MVSQRTQAPSGLGYVLENRIILSRVFPDAFRELRVQHLASGYRRLLDTLQQLATPLAHGGSPRLAVWTPGPHNETYFEHAYLARYLGLPLVEGADLTVRDSQVFLKTVQGLEPVHGLLRRVDDDWCDPLELRADSTLGVPGLLQAVRAGRVLVANALGTGFLESPAIQGFLPGLGRRLLNEELALASLPTWWCGEQAAWEATQGDLGERVVRATYRGGGSLLRAGDRQEPRRGGACVSWHARASSATRTATPCRSAWPSRRHPCGRTAGCSRARPCCGCMRWPMRAAAGTCCRAA